MTTHYGIQNRGYGARYGHAVESGCGIAHRHTLAFCIPFFDSQEAYDA